MRRCLGLAVVLLLVVVAPAAAVAPLGLPCAPAFGSVACSGLVASWDGTPLDVTVVLPAGASSRLPLVASLNGFGNSKHEYLDPASEAYTGNAWRWAREGYAALTYTARGQWGSCGTPEARLASAGACARGYLHLADTRYEARDAQWLIGLLVDDGVADPARLGVTGDSYGGGQSLALAALRNRVMLPDGSYAPWTSPAGTALSLAAAAPVIPWSDLVGAIAPNGLTRAVGVTNPAVVGAPVGVFKFTIAHAILAAAQTAIGPGQPIGEPFIPARPMGYLSVDDWQANVIGWVARTDLGEPYTDAGAQEIVAMMRRFHSAFGVDASVAPPPLFVGAGFTDDIFPVDETLRFVNRMQSLHPDVPVSLLFGDFGHQRAANKGADRERLLGAVHAWMARWLLGRGTVPHAEVVATTQACPRSAPSGGPFRARSFAALAVGRLTRAFRGTQVVSSIGDVQAGLTIDPVAGGGDGCASVASRDAAGTAVYRLGPAPAGGWTLLGAPALRATLSVSGAAPDVAQVAARLWDVAPDGRQTLVTRGSYRPVGSAWELHPAAWTFQPGHTARLELLTADVPYGRPSATAFTVTVKDLTLTLPLHVADTSRHRRARPIRRAARFTKVNRQIPRVSGSSD